MPNTVRVPITNIYMGGGYTAQILVGAEQKPMNVILDMGSSGLALDALKYKPEAADERTRLAQTDSYGDGGSWTGALINTAVAVGGNGSKAVLPGANVAIAYDATANMLGRADGILGLAYAPLDDAFWMPQDTWAHQYTGAQVSQGIKTEIEPYLTQLTKAGVVSDIVAFYTKRSFVHCGGTKDPLNQGWMIAGGGQSETDLYTAQFQTVKVLADEWYNTNLKAVIVGDKPAIAVKPRGGRGMPSNSIVDCGTNSLNLPAHLLQAVFAQFTSAQQQLLHRSALDGQYVPTSSLQLAQWPDIVLVLQGESADMRLRVPAENYWQLDVEQPGQSMAALTQGDPNLSILGLPLINGYFTIFDGEADNGRGAIRFATRT